MNTIQSLNPATGELLAEYAVHTTADVLDAVHDARQAQLWWENQGSQGRRRHLDAWAGYIWARRDELTEILHAENGKPSKDCTIEIFMALEHLRWAARNAARVLRTRKVNTGLVMANHRAEVQHRPLGVVGVIAPWNYPFYTPMGSVGYALAAGNGVVLKPSEYTIGVGQWMVSSFARAVPDAPQGLFGMVIGSGEVGQALCGSGVDKIAFTGSTATGRKVMATCAQTLTPLTLECGGKDAAIVLADADVDEAAQAIAWGALSNAGQTCVGIERAYVVDSVREQFLGRLRTLVQSVRPGSDSGAQYGPMTTPEQGDIVRAHVADALDRGAQSLLGNVDLPSGNFLPPTILVGAPNESLAVAEETFGPTLTVTTVADADEAVRLVNSHRYGLAAAVFGHKDAENIANRLDVGVVSVNAAIAFAGIPAMPLGGRRDSGFGRIHGDEGLLGFTRPFAISVKRFGIPTADVMRLDPNPLAIPALRVLGGVRNRRRNAGANAVASTTPPQPAAQLTEAQLKQAQLKETQVNTTRLKHAAPDTEQTGATTAGVSPSGNARTFCEAFQQTVTAHPDAVALRTPGDEKSITWTQYGKYVRNIAAALHDMGVRRGDAVALMMRNCPEFHLIDTALLHLGAVPFSIYNTSSGEQITHLLTDSGAVLAIVEKLFADVIGPCTEQTGTRLLGLDDIEGYATTEPAADFDFEAQWRAVTPEDLVTLIYTSGTTGVSKGVEITHAAELAQCRATNEIFHVMPADRFISFLPSAHIADRWAGHYTNITAATELTCVADIKQLAPAIADCRPTVFGGVPQVWQRLWNGVTAAVDGLVAAEPNPERKAFLATALEVGRRHAELADSGELDGETNALWQLLDSSLFSVLRKRLGLDACRIAISGAAPIPIELLLSLRGIGIPLTNVLGLSELSGMTTYSSPGQAPAHSVGHPIPGVQVSTADDGELLVRGPVLMRGYRHLAEASTAVIDHDGWLHTGDVASIDSTGAITIVDRKKELMVSTGGKNLSPVAIESALLSASPLIGYAVAIGDARPYVTALIVLDPETLLPYAQRQGISADFADLVDHPVVRADIAAAVERANQRLSRPEQIRTHMVLADIWEPGTNVLTPTRKLRRVAIHQDYAAAIDSLY